ncbi:gustatory receptor for sugar taste 64a-like isoform X2 [Spodoptera litura]|uniref:Gustatory receptor for sugar taste 64a-like isoform X2 n=1 Tax=Spodoptera litura TaxID=69820 RepID=A0A9J7IWG6_SPOLT|nr:gustatory receptor for sugar taste 64a-like isoform X2 [Spodoptera litura]
MSKTNYGQFLRNTNLILPKQPNHDEFLMVMENVFRCSCLIGVLGAKKWICYVWSAFILIVLLVMESQAIWKVIKALAGWAIDTAGQRSVTARLAGTIFYTIAIISLILASKLFRSWGELSALWVRVERVMAVKVPSDGTLKRRMYFIIGFMTVCSLHEYSDWYAIPLAFMSTIATMLWNFQDQLIVLISMGLTSRYSRLNQCLAKICALEKKQMDSDQKTEATKVYTWRKLREAYVKQAMLVRKVDDAIGGIIILSCFCNFYFICLQLFLGITQSQSSEPLRTVYYFTSLGWLCFRVIIVVLAASDINVHSQIALNHIYTHDTLYYNIEMGRLQDQLSKDYVALSGKGFFYLSKSILLQMAGAVITYELVLIQFDDKGTDDVQLNLTKNGVGVD